MSNVEMLLEYMSALKRGTWTKFRSAVDEITRLDNEDAPRWTASVIAEHLAILGHAEFAFESTLEWEVMPARIVPVPALGENRGVLTGSRLSDLTDLIDRFADSGQVCIVRKDHRYAPDVIELHAIGDHSLAEIAREIGVPIEQSGATHLASVLPDISSMYDAAPGDNPPIGYPTFCFDPQQLDWLTVERVDGPGSYRFDRYRPVHLIVRDGSVKKVSSSVAIYDALIQSGRQVTTYNASGREMLVPAKAALPVLYARALILMTGRLPLYDRRSNMRRFQAIPETVARTVQRKLGETESSHE